jgi:hypothetical protein
MHQQLVGKRPPAALTVCWGLFGPYVDNLPQSPVSPPSPRAPVRPCSLFPVPGDDACAPQLDELRKVLGEVQGIVNYGTVNTTGEAQAQGSAGMPRFSRQAYGLGGRHMERGIPCAPALLATCQAEPACQNNGAGGINHLLKCCSCNQCGCVS